jgi:predicted Zn-dependent peptidase
VTATLVPGLTKPRVAKKLVSEQRTLRNGLTVIAVRKPGVPLVEVRLRLPALSTKANRPAQVNLLASSMLTGAGRLDRAGIASAIQALGGDLSVSADADRILIGGNVLATELDALLGLLARVLTGATYADEEVEIERDRLVENLVIARSRPNVVAGEALAHRMWGEHPYALDLPTPEWVAATTAAQVRTLHEQIVKPGPEATLVLVGDVAPAKMIELATAALRRWQGPSVRGRVPKLPTPPSHQPLLVIDRPGSVQTSVRLARPAVPRSDPRSAALQLANLIFGGYFSSRWTENIREDKGYTYGPHSRIDHQVLGSTLAFDVEVATEVTGPAMLETLYELGRIASLPVTSDELESVRQYAIGTLALSTATQAGLASTLSMLSAFGLGLEWILEHPKRLQALSLEDVSAAAAEFFAPASLTAVVVGDAAAIAGPLGALLPVELAHV